MQLQLKLARDSNESTPLRMTSCFTVLNSKSQKYRVLRRQVINDENVYAKRSEPDTGNHHAVFNLWLDKYLVSLTGTELTSLYKLNFPTTTPCNNVQTLQMFDDLTSISLIWGTKNGLFQTRFPFLSFIYI